MTVKCPVCNERWYKDTDIKAHLLTHPAEHLADGIIDLENVYNDEFWEVRPND